MAREMGKVQRTIRALVSKEFAAKERIQQPVAPLGWESTLRWGLVGTCLTFGLFGVGLIMPIVAFGIISLALSWMFLALTLLVVFRDVETRPRAILTIVILISAGYGIAQLVRLQPSKPTITEIAEFAATRVMAINPGRQPNLKNYTGAAFWIENGFAATCSAAVYDPPSPPHSPWFCLLLQGSAGRFAYSAEVSW
jgi:hypothetical protein